MTLNELNQKVRKLEFSVNNDDIPLKQNGKDFDIDFDVVTKDSKVLYIETKTLK